jgi:transcriptional regulator with XRE-family HTH domain
MMGFKSANRISQWENGTALPNAANLFRLSRLYRTLPTDLLCDLYRIESAKIDAAEKAFLESQGKDSFFPESV